MSSFDVVLFLFFFCSFKNYYDCCPDSFATNQLLIFSTHQNICFHITLSMILVHYYIIILTDMYIQNISISPYPYPYISNILCLFYTIISLFKTKTIIYENFTSDDIFETLGQSLIFALVSFTI